jgi:RHH-type proline utilization regulon transcriptional repressor/proline dehydrogenase/delta 1-pyrroline-5-carboxylate dehydrogenase
VHQGSGQDRLADGVAEVREAVDFLRYYGAQARKLFAPEALPGPTGESNTLQMSGRGVFVCISPVELPAGDLRRPDRRGARRRQCRDRQARRADQPDRLLRREVAARSGHPGSGAAVPAGRRAPPVGAALTRDPRIAGVAFTGSTDTARAINRALAARDSAIGVLIAETGGQNALIADSSSLPEQVVKDAIASAFTSAGQRCSAARVLFVQDDIADKVIAMLAGAMAELKVGDPACCRPTSAR